MTYRLVAALLTTAAGCASAGSGSPIDETPDASGTVDTNSELPDAALPIDTMTPCTPTPTNLLVNGNFDAAPIGTGWTAAPLDPAYPLVTASGTLVQSAPNKAWLGGLERAGSDSLFQDVAIPASATDLKLTGFFEVRSAELSTTTVYDHAEVDLVTPAGVVLHAITVKSNATRTTSFQPLDFVFPAAHAGETVRLRFKSTSDASFVTSFYFDTLALTATICE